MIQQVDCINLKKLFFEVRLTFVPSRDLHCTVTTTTHYIVPCVGKSITLMILADLTLLLPLSLLSSRPPKILYFFFFYVQYYSLIRLPFGRAHNIIIYT